MRLKDQNLDIIDENEGTRSHYEANNLIIYNFGCLISNADAFKLFYLLKDKILHPTIIIFCCNATKGYEADAVLNIIRLKEKYTAYKFFITGCMNEIVENKYKKYGTIIYKENMWDLQNYE